MFRPLRVGFAYNVKRIAPSVSQKRIEDREAEYDAPSTLAAIREAIASFGHQVVDLEATETFPSTLLANPVDVVFNIAEGLRGRTRESHVPAVLELLNIPYTGSDPTALALALDKALAKTVVRSVGVDTPPSQVMHTGRERLDRALGPWPLMVKPVAEGSSKGVGPKSVAHSEAELRSVVRQLVERYRQPALVETFVSGREFTVGVLGERRLTVLPPMEVVFTDPSDPTPIYRFEDKLAANNRIRYDIPARLPQATTAKLTGLARAVFRALGCRDVARIDFRMDAAGRMYFLECNPLPGLTPQWGDLVMIAAAGGLDYRTLIHEILSGALRRYRERAAPRRRSPQPSARPRL